MAEGMSLARFAKRLGVTPWAVGKAVASGRLSQSVGRDGRGRPFIADVGIAEREWRENRSRPTPGRGDSKVVTLTAATLEVMQERKRKLQLENAEREGQLIDRNTVVKEAFESERIIRETILNLPARIAGEIAAETEPARVFALLDKAFRNVLDEAADALVATGESGTSD